MSAAETSSRNEAWSLAEGLMSSLLEAIRRIDELGPCFPDELHEARDPGTDMQVVDFIERLARHSLQHRHELTSIRASIGASRPTDPGDSHPTSDTPYAATWVQWFLLEAFLRRAELVSELIGLTDDDLDRKPAPEHVAGNERSIREVCEHVQHVQSWLMSGIEGGLETYRGSGSSEEA
ncbi:MAG TPA: hypothetical protein QGF95_15625 [Candidatus Latescibacteria bacterium]|jgi:hypothetical protein|nr:hypothetical protein [Gemmatimonadaceae bacterium]MDP6017849.1 hypothetical protein [Candidatus Latescibacterota bacterium]HJP31973.1 hypothetical protein [Candidatus Latescibacterota bacterium]